MTQPKLIHLLDIGLHLESGVMFRMKLSLWKHNVWPVINETQPFTNEVLNVEVGILCIIKSPYIYLMSWNKHALYLLWLQNCKSL